MSDNMPDPQMRRVSDIVADYYADHTAYVAESGRLLAGNKQVLFDALAAAGVTQVVVTFDGYGDSGQIENIEVLCGEANCSLPEAEITLTLAGWRGGETKTEVLSLEDAIEHLVYDFLNQTHSGWENNDGAYGEFTFDVAGRIISLVYNERYTASESFAHEF
ncbi:MAG: hypothetical protein Q4G49_04310 [Paracoccus sp. (in: a-proteobacteria)]|nr:hypothetical protein [Paracoccus sp. (in: a-proteobacteria)]